jgi:hypothetical protein
MVTPPKRHRKTKLPRGTIATVSRSKAFKRGLSFLEEALENVYRNKENNCRILFNPDFCQGLQIPKLNGHRFFRPNGRRFR